MTTADPGVRACTATDATDSPPSNDRTLAAEFAHRRAIAGGRMPANPYPPPAGGALPTCVIVATCTALACAGDPAGPQDLRLHAEVVPSPVTAGDAFVARVTVANVGSGPYVLRSTCPRLGVPRVLRDGRRVAFEGAVVDDIGDCVMLVASAPADTVQPDRALVFEWPMRAVVDGEPAPPASYRFRLDVTEAGVDDVEAAFVVEAAR